MSTVQSSQSALISSFRVEPAAGKDARPTQENMQPYMANYNFHQQPYPHYSAADIKGEAGDPSQDHVPFFHAYPQHQTLYENQQATPPSPDTEKQNDYYRRHSWASSKKDEDGLYSPSSNESSNEIYDTENQRAQYVL
jgi:hypothetical protein